MEELFSIDDNSQFVNICKTALNIEQLTPNNELVKKVKQDFYNTLSSHDFDTNSTIEDIQSKGWNEEKIVFLKTLIEDNRAAVLYGAILDHTKVHGECLVEFDWTVKLVLGTSKSKNIKYPLLELLLCTEDNTEKQKKKIFYVTKNMLSQIIDTLESIK